MRSVSLDDVETLLLETLYLVLNVEERMQLEVCVVGCHNF